MGVTLLVSVDNYDIPDIISVNSLKNTDWGTVDCLIYHSSIDSELDMGLEINKMRGEVQKVIYINQTISPLTYCLFTGLDADIYDNEDYLSDSSVLDFLKSSYKTTGMTIKPPSADFEILARGIATISSSNYETIQKFVSNPFWVKSLSTAVINVEGALDRTSKLSVDIEEMFSEVAKLIGGQKENQENTGRELESAMKLITEMEKKPRPNAPFIFSTYSVPVNVSKVLYIKAYGNCKYLNSFVLAYQHYLRNSKQYSSKLLVALPKLKINMQRYNNVARLAPDSIDMVDMNVSDVYITYEPKKIIMDAFFGQQNVQIFIVLDLMLDTEKLVQGHMVENFYALSSLSDVGKFKLKPERCLNAISTNGVTLQIPHITKYTEANDSVRRTMYFDKCVETFKKIDGLLLKNGR
jgi:hypothetical protein